MSSIKFCPDDSTVFPKFLQINYSIVNRVRATVASLVAMGRSYRAAREQIAELLGERIVSQGACGDLMNVCADL